MSAHVACSAPWRTRQRAGGPQPQKRRSACTRQDLAVAPTCPQVQGPGLRETRPFRQAQEIRLESEWQVSAKAFKGG